MPDEDARNNHRYHPFYCEENIYYLCSDLIGSHHRLQALFISNARRACLFHNQKATPPGRPTVWDYHVVLLDGPSNDVPRYRIRDFDTRLSFGIDAEEYLQKTFDRPGSDRFRPRFRLVSAREFLATFSTDRRHMRKDPENQASPWLQPPPPWDPPRGSNAASEHELPAYISMEPEGPGVLVDLEELLEMIR
ncbi:MAG: hypothetical protein EA427_06015 [Spirochaetaceae bacterium]|nr:MAG: hypothetical protein EA427_06015 [Spirochaetaceae bacterium]